uniref:Uncharacterized protein n=1 Tax=Nelumbo nucifera TaxID=4432 RepID=A0A822Z185_NELNU|nr:TPA_asm: hypothetical protein HUJ06_005888 [Nelumbo nucifera]
MELLQGPGLWIHKSFYKHFDHSNLLFEYKNSSDGKVYDSFRISRDYRNIMACSVDSCPSMTLAS